MPTDDTDTLLLEGLQKLYYVEQSLVDALETLAEQTSEERVSQAFTDHREETMNQIERLESIFDDLGVEATAEPEQVVDALIDEHETVAGDLEGVALDRYNMGVAQKTEHYEIGAYGHLTSIADKLGYDYVADLLEETLREEQAALEKVSEATESFDADVITEQR